MTTKVTNCGNYKCAHCSSDGRCLVGKISIDSDGKCAIFRLPAGKVVPINEHTERKDLEKKHTSMLTTFEERVASHKESLQHESTSALEELRYSHVCSVETAAAIDLILKERQL